jgi:hypothetical protein
VLDQLGWLSIGVTLASILIDRHHIFNILSVSVTPEHLLVVIVISTLDVNIYRLAYIVNTI